MKAALIDEPKSLRVVDMAPPVARSGEVLVAIRAAAINRRDTYVIDGIQEHPLPLTPGSDGAGCRMDTGEEVVILPTLNWGKNEACPEPGWGILGGPTNGTWAEIVSVPLVNVYPKPTHLSWEEAAALPLAGVTAYRGLFARAGLKKGESLLILGAGSGVSTVALQLALAIGAIVFVTSSSQQKLDRAIAMGATAGALYSDPKWMEQIRTLSGGVDVAFDSVGTTWQQSLHCINPGGRLVVFGATGGLQAVLGVRSVFQGQYSILGTMMGSPSDFENLLELVEVSGMRPVVDSSVPLADVAKPLSTIRAGEQFGKLVLTM